jgi:hypothetical protein
MALASNQKEQMAKRLKQELELSATEYTIAAKQDADSDPVIEVKLSTTVVALIAIKRKTFTGFNIVNEISSSAGNGFPEHDMWLVVKDDLTLVGMAKITKAAAAIGCSTMKIAVEASADLTDIGDESKVVAQLPNTARYGFSGN